MDDDPALVFDDDPAVFLDRAGSHLADAPVLNSVLATTALRTRDELRRGVRSLPAGSWFCTVTGAGGAVLGTAMLTTPPPHRTAYLLPMPDRAAVALARALHDRGEATTGANGALPAVRVFAEEVARLAGGAVRVQAHTRLFELRELLPPRPAPGGLRPADADDTALVERWLAAFHGDADEQAGRGRGSAPDLGTEEVGRRIAAGRVWLWEDGGRPVHLTGANAATFRAQRIGPVYTPADRRGHGYASAAVAEISRRILADGARPCLFTDQANPTSNKIYTALGYRAVTDMVNLIID